MRVQPMSWGIVFRGLDLGDDEEGWRGAGTCTRAGGPQGEEENDINPSNLKQLRLEGVEIICIENDCTRRRQTFLNLSILLRHSRCQMTPRRRHQQ